MKLEAKLKELGEFANVQRGSMSVTEWLKAVKKALDKSEFTQADDIYKELKAGTLKKPSGAIPSSSPSSGAAKVEVVSPARTSSPKSGEIIPSHQNVAVGAPNLHFNFPQPNVTVNNGTLTFGQIARDAFAWTQTYALGLFSGILATLVFMKAIH